MILDLARDSQHVPGRNDLVENPWSLLADRELHHQVCAWPGLGHCFLGAHVDRVHHEPRSGTGDGARTRGKHDPGAEQHEVAPEPAAQEKYARRRCRAPPAAHSLRHALCPTHSSAPLRMLAGSAVRCARAIPTTASATTARMTAASRAMPTHGTITRTLGRVGAPLGETAINGPTSHPSSTPSPMPIALETTLTMTASAPTRPTSIRLDRPMARNCASSVRRDRRLAEVCTANPAIASSPAPRMASHSAACAETRIGSCCSCRARTSLLSAGATPPRVG